MLGNLKKYIIIATFFTTAGCVSSYLKPETKKWVEIRGTDTYQKEKNIYLKRLGGREFCWNIGLSNFLSSYGPKPNKNCLYPTSKFVTGYDGLIIYEKVLQQGFRELKVLQITDDGYLVSSPRYNKNQIIFIQKSTESNVVDGSFIDEAQNWNFYEYIGPYSYSTAMGQKTVHSFRKISKEKFADAREGLELYRPKREFFIKNELWGYLNESSADTNQ